MKRNLKEEIENIFKNSWHPMISGGNYFNELKAEKQLLTLFSKTLDNVIGEDEGVAGMESDMGAVADSLRADQRARKELVLSDKEGELGL